jgi:hypothetical protein
MIFLNTFVATLYIGIFVSINTPECMQELSIGGIKIFHELSKANFESHAIQLHGLKSSAECWHGNSTK